MRERPLVVGLCLFVIALVLGVVAGMASDKTAEKKEKVEEEPAPPPPRRSFPVGDALPDDDLVGYEGWAWLSALERVTDPRSHAGEVAHLAFFVRRASLTIDAREAKTGAWHALADGKPFIRVYAVPLDQEGADAINEGTFAGLTLGRKEGMLRTSCGPSNVGTICITSPATTGPATPAAAATRPMGATTTTFFGYADRRILPGEHPVDAMRRERLH